VVRLRLTILTGEGAGVANTCSAGTGIPYGISGATLVVLQVGSSNGIEGSVRARLCAVINERDRAMTRIAATLVDPCSISCALAMYSAGRNCRRALFIVFEMLEPVSLLNSASACAMTSPHRNCGRSVTRNFLFRFDLLLGAPASFMLWEELLICARGYTDV